MTDNFTQWKNFIARKGYRPRLSVTKKIAKKNGMCEAERLNENRLGKWEKRAAENPSLLKTSSRKAEFVKLRKSTPTFFQKSHDKIIKEWKDFIERKGYLPRDVISEAEAKQSGMTKDERLEEIRLGSIARWIKQNLDNREGALERWCYTEQQRKDFMKIWNAAPSFQNKSQSEKFAEWKKFIALKGYLPRTTITGKEAETTNLSKEEQEEEIRLGKWASHLGGQRSLPTEKEQAEFDKIKSKTPSFVEAHGRLFYRKCKRETNTKNTEHWFEKWKKFIERKGYKPRASISAMIAKKNGLSKIEQQEETRLGKWANHFINRKLSGMAEQQRAEFWKIFNDTPTWGEFLKKQHHI